MNRVRIGSLVLLAWLLPCLVLAQDGQLTPEGEVAIDGKPWVVYSDPGGMRVLVARPIPGYAIERLERVVSFVRAWKVIAPSEIRADFSGGEEGGDYVVIVSRVTSASKDYATHIPSGIRLRFSGTLLYDFRVKSGDYFVRVRGVLVDDASLVEEIAMAVDYPAAYIAERDPSWAASRILELEGTIESSRLAIGALRESLAAHMNKGLFGRPRPVSAAMVELVYRLKLEKPDADRAMALVYAKSMGHTTSTKEIDIIFSVWFGE